MLLARDPEDRPGAQVREYTFVWSSVDTQVILDEDWLPPKPEDEYMDDAIRSLTERNSHFHQRVVETRK